MPGRIKAVIFDMDGTLIDSMGVWDRIDEEFVTQRGIDCDVSAYQKEIAGKSYYQTACYSIEKFGLTETPEELQAIWDEMAIDIYRTQIPLKDGVRDFLDFLKERGIRMAIATSNSRKLVDPCLDHLEVREYFDGIITSKEVQNGKPEPDVYLAAAKLLGTDPADCLVFEDIPEGIIAGKRAGMKVVGVEDQSSVWCREEKKKLSDLFINSFQELKDERIKRTLGLSEEAEDRAGA